MPEPKFGIGQVAFELIGHVIADGLQRGIWQAVARAAIAAGVRRRQWRTWAFELQPGGDPAQGIAAGGAPFEHLSQEGPKSDQLREEALATIEPLDRGAKERLWDKVTERFLILA